MRSNFGGIYRHKWWFRRRSRLCRIYFLGYLRRRRSTVTACCAPVGWTTRPIVGVHLSWLQISEVRYPGCPPSSSPLASARVRITLRSPGTYLNPLVSGGLIYFPLVVDVDTVGRRFGSVYIDLKYSKIYVQNASIDEVVAMRSFLSGFRPSCQCGSLLWRELPRWYVLLLLWQTPPTRMLISWFLSFHRFVWERMDVLRASRQRVR